MVSDGENLRVLIDASQPPGLCNLRRKPGVDETKRTSSHCNHQVKNSQTGGAASTRSVKHHGGGVLVSKMATSTSSTAAVFACGMLAGIAGSFILQLHDRSKANTLCALHGAGVSYIFDSGKVFLEAKVEYVLGLSTKINHVCPRGK